MMLRLKMENLTIAFIVLSLVVYFLECAVVEGKTLDPIYWNSSNPLFKMHVRRNHLGLETAINDKLDIICPRKGRDDGEELFYFKLYLVNEEDFRKCNATGGKRLITCNVPDQEKKYTFYFQEISPSPWGLEFDPEKSYYVISTSDGTKSGIGALKGGVCTRFNMKIELKIHAAEDVRSPSAISPPLPPIHDDPAKKDENEVKQAISDETNDETNPDTSLDGTDDGSTKTGTDDHFSGSGMIIGIVVGALAVLLFVFLGFVGYRIYRRRQHHKKYQSPPMTPTRGNTPLQQVTLLPISPTSHHAHHHHGRLHSDHERNRSATISSHNDLRPPPSYNESFLDNGGPVVAV